MQPVYNMNPLNGILVFDIGKTNKKCLVYDEQYQLIFEESVQLKEIIDEDGFPSEDLSALKNWLFQAFQKVIQSTQWNIKALSFSAYGASLVYLDEQGEPVGGLKNYLKPVNEALYQDFFEKYGPASELARSTCSPILGNLNSGYQAFEDSKKLSWCKVSDILHFPNYLGFLFHGERVSEMTSIGCHTLLWNFDVQKYHEWVQKEGLLSKLPPIKNGSITYFSKQNRLKVGLGLHDSSAALVPYLRQFKKPFVLISTGTWCISMNPFDNSALSALELENDVLAYAQMDGKPVKSARLFAGNEHEQMCKKLAIHFKLEEKFYKEIRYNHQTALLFEKKLFQEKSRKRNATFLKESDFVQKDLANYTSAEEAYQDFMTDLVIQFLYSLSFVFAAQPDFMLLVDGGFSKNDIFMNCLAKAFPDIEVFGAEVAQASSLGAALAIHEHWNEQEIPSNLIKLRPFKG